MASDLMKKICKLCFGELGKKGDNSAGSYGIGHMLAISISDLRYVLYAGQYSNEAPIASGRAILAPFKENRQLMGGDGCLSKEVNDDGTIEFCRGNEIPPFLKGKLNFLKEWGWDTGTVIVIPGFNNFKEIRKSKNDDHCINTIFRAAAKNFAPAFFNKKIEIEINGKKLNNKNSEEKITGKSNDDLISENSAENIYETLREEDLIVKVDSDDIKIKLKKLEPGSNRHEIDLFRNNMWITNNSKPWANKSIKEEYFRGYEPFHCVILLEQGTDIFQTCEEV